MNKQPTCFLLILFAVFLSACNIDVQVSGSGRVISVASMIDCRENTGTCSIQEYGKLDTNAEYFSTTTLRAIPDEGYFLKNWEGDCFDIIANKCLLHLDGDISVKAVFEPIQYAPGPGQVNSTVKFIALGGGGKGTIVQYQVATAIASLCEKKGCDFIMGLGNNFSGDIPEDSYSRLFEDKFEFPYQSLDLPFYMVLGNQDTDLIEGNGGNQALGEVQVEYHYRTDKLSNKWQMPARYYSFIYPQNPLSPLAQFFALDSAPFVGLVDPDVKYEPYQYAKVEGAWIDQQRIPSDDVWKIAFAHHSYISNGRQGNAGAYNTVSSEGVSGDSALDKNSGRIFRQFMEGYVCDHFDLFISAYDKNLQALRPVSTCGKTEFIVSGGGSESEIIEFPEDNAVHFQLGDQPGFFYITISGNHLTMTAVSVDIDTGVYIENFSKTLQKKQ